MFEDLENSIQQLIFLGKGDVGRLEYILDLLKKGKILPVSDQKYLENILPLHSSQKYSESIQYEHMIEKLHKEIGILNEKLSRTQNKGFEKIIGRKAIFFFVTVFVGWNVMRPSVAYVLDLDVLNSMAQYLFPLNSLANYFNSGSLLSFIFMLMILAWPFIGAVSLVNHVGTRKP